MKQFYPNVLFATARAVHSSQRASSRHFSAIKLSLVLALFLGVSGLGWGQIASLELGIAPQSGNTTGAATFTGKDANISALPALTLTVAQQGQAGGNGYVASKSWVSASLNTATYWQFTVTASSGYQIAVTSLALRMYRSSTGPSSIALATDDDSYAATIGGTQTLPSAAYTISFSGLTLSGKTSITFRVYAWGASSATGTLRIGDGTASSLDINLQGTVTSTGGGSTPPALNPDVTQNDVDHNIDITFTNDPAWFAAVTAVKIGVTPLTVNTDYVLTAGNLQLKPSGGNALLTTSGSKAVSIVATGYSDASTTQIINAGAATKLGITTQPADPLSNGATLATQPVIVIQDQYANTTTSTATVVATKSDAGSWTLGGTNSVGGISGTVTFTDLTATSVAAVSGAKINFTSSPLTSIESNTFSIPAPPSNLLFYDDFTGLTVGSNLAGQSSWTKGGTGPDPTIGNATALTYTGYNGGNGEYVIMPAGSSSTSKVYKGITTAAPGTNTFYYSLLLNLTSATATGDYFITLGDPGAGTTYFARLFAKSSGAGFVIGGSKLAAAANATYGSTVFSFNTTYLVVVRYTFVPLATNDLMYVWVNPSLCSEPSTSSATVTVPGSDIDAAPSNVGNFLWHNRSANNPTGSFDGLRVAFGSTSSIAWSSLNAYFGSPPTATPGPYGYGTVSIPYTILGAGASNYSSFSWSADKAGSWTGSTNTLSPVFTASTFGEYTFTLTVTGNDPCSTPASIQMKAYFLPAAASLTWTGNTNNDWGLWSNWNATLVPGSTTDVSIPSGLTNYPTAVSGFCHNLTIGAGASILGNGNLTISGTSSIDLQITGGADTWHLFCLPTITGISTASPFFDLAYVDKYVEADGVWTRLAGNNPVAPKTGYSINYESGSHVKTFTGTLNSGDQTFSSLSYTTGIGGYGPGWHLLGNPFPSAVNTTLGSWAKTYLDGYVYVWDGAQYVCAPTHSGFGTLAGNIIPSMQGFFVHATAAGASITVPEAARVHNNTGFYKNSEVFNNSLFLTINGNGYEDKAIVAFNPSATATFDGQYDAYKLFGIDAAPQLYSIVPGNILTVNSLPSIEDNHLVPLGVKVGGSTTYTLTVTGIESFDPLVSVNLDDLLLGTTQDLRLLPAYSFTASPGDTENRFNLRFASANGINDPVASGINIYAVQELIHVKHAIAASGIVYVYSVSGQLVAQKVLSPGETLLSVGVPGVYMVKVVTDKTIVTGKVVVTQ